MEEVAAKLAASDTSLPPAEGVVAKKQSYPTMEKAALDHDVQLDAGFRAMRGDARVSARWTSYVPIIVWQQGHRGV